MKAKIAEQVKKIKEIANGRPTGFVIGNTSDIFPRGRFYEIPNRETSSIVYGGVIVRDVETAMDIALLVDGKVDNIFVDDEKKIRKIYYGPHDYDRGNIEKPLRAIIKKSRMLTYKGNDLAAEATNMLVGNSIPVVSGTTCAIIGLGNLGSKIALKLVERGVNVSAFRRNKKKLRFIVAGLNSIKSENTMAKIISATSIESACRGANVVIAVTNEKEIVSKKMLETASSSAVLIDVGKGCFADDVTKNSSGVVYRLDVSIVQKHFFSALVGQKDLYKKPLGRREIKEIDTMLVSLGIFGRRGEVIVDDIEHPTSIIGISAGNGLLKKNTPSVEKQIKMLKKYLGIA